MYFQACLVLTPACYTDFIFNFSSCHLVIAKSARVYKANVSGISMTCWKILFWFYKPIFENELYILLQHEVYYDHSLKAKIPSLFVVGDGDQVINPRRSEALLDFFEQPKVIRHDGGHYVPATSKQKASYLEFLQERLKEKFE